MTWLAHVARCDYCWWRLGLNERLGSVWGTCQHSLLENCRVRSPILEPGTSNHHGSVLTIQPPPMFCNSSFWCKLGWCLEKLSVSNLGPQITTTTPLPLNHRLCFEWEEKKEKEKKNEGKKREKHEEFPMRVLIINVLENCYHRTWDTKSPRRLPYHSTTSYISRFEFLMQALIITVLEYCHYRTWDPTSPRRLFYHSTTAYILRFMFPLQVWMMPSWSIVTIEPGPSRSSLSRWPFDRHLHSAIQVSDASSDDAVSQNFTARV